jgi:hypothetical protein
VEHITPLTAVARRPEMILDGVMELEGYWKDADSVNVTKESPLNIRDWVLQIQELEHSLMVS